MKPTFTLNTFSLFILLHPTDPFLLLTLVAYLGKIFHCALVVLYVMGLLKMSRMESRGTEVKDSR